MIYSKAHSENSFRKEYFLLPLIYIMLVSSSDNYMWQHGKIPKTKKTDFEKQIYFVYCLNIAYF
jgi:hypothetical protein